jgi:hypothetical protein
MAKKQQLTIKAPERPAPAETSRQAQPIYELSTTTLEAAPTSIALPPEAETLSERLRELAVRFIGSRRRVGEALLEACRYMSEARATAEEGQWYVFLRVTGTSPDSAETLLNIHTRAAQSPVFAEKIRSGWLNQTVAGELAKPSTPPQVFQELLKRDEPLRVADVKRARRLPAVNREDNHIVDNPNYSGSLDPAETLSAHQDVAQVVAEAEQTTLTALLAEVAESLEAIAEQAHVLPPSERTLQTLYRIEQATGAIRRRMAPAE